MGHALTARGVTAGDRVLLVLLDSLEFVAAFLGTAKIGAVAVPTNTTLRTADYAYFLEETRAAAVIVHAALLSEVAPRLEGVELVGDEASREILGDRVGAIATDDDYATEFLDLKLAVRVVDTLDAAIAHITRYGSGHSEAIVTNDLRAADRFVNEVDAAAVLVNASTRFVDGEELGFGAEIGISTQKLHARGPMGLRELTTTKFVVIGDGQIRE